MRMVVMSPAGFVLAINIFVATLFCGAFGAVAVRHRSAKGAHWLVAGYGMGILNAAIEFVLPNQIDPRPLSIVLFAVALSAFLACIVGLARHYAVRVPWAALAALGLGSTLANGLAIYLTQDAFAALVIYQAPYFIAHLLAMWMVVRAPRRLALDWTLLVFLGLASLQFLFKPYMAMQMGGSGPHAYIYGLYGAYSQLLIAFLLIANGVLMLLIFVRDVTAAITLRGDTDLLSGLFNRRGFEDRADRMLAWARREHRPLALVVADLDHFKQINDTLGHAAGDQAIKAFSAILQQTAPGTAVIGRMGGEEFAILLCNGSIAMGRLLAEATRQALHAEGIVAAPEPRQVTASFGVTAIGPDEHLSDALRRADAALYQAKRTGRDRVCVADPAVDGDAMPKAPLQPEDVEPELRSQWG